MTGREFSALPHAAQHAAAQYARGSEVAAEGWAGLGLAPSQLAPAARAWCRRERVPLPEHLREKPGPAPREAEAATEVARVRLTPAERGLLEALRVRLEVPTQADAIRAAIRIASEG